MKTETTFTFTDAKDGVRIRIASKPPYDNEHLFGVVENGMPRTKILHDAAHAAMHMLDLFCEQIAEGRIATPITIEYNGEEAHPRPHPHDQETQ